MMALRVVPRQEQSWFNGNQAAVTNSNAVVSDSSSPRVVLPDAVVELAPEEESGSCGRAKKFRFGIFISLAALAVVGVVVGVVVGTRKGGTALASGDNPTAEDGVSPTDTHKNPNNQKFDIGGPCFIGGVLFDCANDLPVRIPDCVVDSYDQYKKNWIPIHDPTAEDYEIDSCAPANLGLIVAAAQGVENNVTDVQKYVLTTFFMSLNGQAWQNNTNWLSASDLNQWKGLSVDNTSGEILGIWLFDNLLEGTLPQQVGLLPSIILNLGENDIEGTIPWQYGALETISLSSNRLTGTIPVEWNEDSIALKNLLLRNNFLTGSVPHMPQLQDLALNRNELTGTITLGTNLHYLGLEQNRFEGTIQEDLGTSLIRIGLSGNLWDENPISLGSLLVGSPGLRFLYLDDSRLAGTIPTEIGNCPNMTYIFLGRNQLTGLLPTELGSLTNLTDIHLERNAMNGTIPSELGNAGALEVLNMFRNDFSGTLSTEFGLLTNLRFFILEGNELSGVIPNEVCRLWDVGDLEILGEADCYDSSCYGGALCPSQECCRNCPGVETVP